MNKISLKIVVAGRTYPLTIEESEEKRVLKAAEDINKSIKMLQDNYAVKDMQDLLAMTALQLATKTNIAINEESYSEIETSLSNLLKKIQQ